MLRRPKVRSHLRLDVAASDLVVARSEDGFSAVEGRLLPLLVPFLDGRHTLDDMAARLAGEATLVDVRFGISLMLEEGWLVEGEREPALTPGVEAFADSLGLDHAVVAARLAESAIEIATIAPEASARPALERATELLTAHLAELGLRVTVFGDRLVPGDRLVVVTADYLAPELAEIDRRERAAGRPWMLLRPVGLRPLIGPVFESPAEGCWACLAARLAENEALRERLPGPLPIAAVSATLELAASAAATQVLRWVAAGRHPGLAGRLLTLDSQTLESAVHRVARQPQCPHCGTPRASSASARDKATALELHHVRPHPFADGGSRAVPPEETWRRFEHHVSPLTGIVRRLERQTIDEAGGGLHVCSAEHLFRPGDEREYLRRAGRQKSAGKGRSFEQARVSALCEALERYSGVFRGDEPRRPAWLAELGDAAIHPNEVLGYSAAQYRERARWNAPGWRQTWVPMPFDESRTVDWTPLWSLSQERVKYLPTALLYYGAPQSANHLFCRADSNGCAAGNHLEEAILQGFLELVERDAVALWWAHRRRRPGVVLESFADPFFASRVELHRRLHRRLRVLDLTSDLGIPVFAAISSRVAPSSAEEGAGWLLGFGAHLEAEIALGRALTEVEQFLPQAIGRERRTLSAEPTTTAFLEPDAALVRKRDDFPVRSGEGDLRGDVIHLVELARRRGLETLVLDQTRADVGLPVVRVVVPGLRHKWPRWGPGRLYDVPVAEGFCAVPPREDELNPVHLLI